MVSWLIMLQSCGLFQQQANAVDKEKKKKESILDLAKYLDKQIRVKFSGGREGSLSCWCVVSCSHVCVCVLI